MDRKYMWFSSFTTEQNEELLQLINVIIDQREEHENKKRNTLPNEFNSLNIYIAGIFDIIMNLYVNGKVSSRGVDLLETQLRKISEAIEKIKDRFEQRKLTKPLDNWIDGEPPHAMWCLVTYLSCDLKPPKVTRLWFNPTYAQKWRDKDTGVSYAFTGKVTHWMPEPLPASNDEN